MNLSKVVKTTKSVITANSPVLLVGAAVAGVIATGVLAAKGGYKARGIVDVAEAEHGPLDNVDKIKLTWLCYAAPAVTGVSTIASVAGVHVIHSKRNAALAGLLGVATSQLDSMQEKAEELLGAKKMQQLENGVAQDQVDSNPYEVRDVEIIPGGAELCHDMCGGRWFRGSMPIIQQAFAELNMHLAENGKASLNDFYDWLGIDSSDVGEMLGWQRGETRIDPIFGSVNTPDGVAITFRFRTAPKPLGRS